MSERLTAIYEEELICAYELTDENGQYIEEVRSELRIASQSGNLFCPECGQRLILCAGAIRIPYFRHFSLEDCQATVVLRTEAGKRSYFCRRLLYDLAKKSGSSEVVLKEQNDDVLKPILFETGQQKRGFVYLDGKSRDYSLLKKNVLNYREEKYRMLLFLPMKYMSKGLNLTSDEAEIGRLNNGLICYIDKDEKKIALRKQYMDLNSIRQNFTVLYDIEKLEFDTNGDFAGDFRRRYEKKVREVKCSFSRVLRIPIDEGLDEDYFDMDYVCMDSFEEIWILPKFLYTLDQYELERENRILYLEQINLEAQGLSEPELQNLAYIACNEINQNRNSWDWDI